MESGPPGLTEDDRRENKERRRRERRERRARRQRQRESDLVHQLDGYCYEGGPAGCHPFGDHLPDLLNSHVPPPAYTTLPGRGHGAISSSCPATTRTPSWRPTFPGFSRRSDGTAGAGATNTDLEHCGPHDSPDVKSCCGISISQTVSIRWFIVMIAFVGICCAVVGTVLGAMKASGREHLTVSLLMIGVGIVLITVSGIAWRLTSQDGPSCRAMLGLASYQDYGDGRFLSRPGYPRGTVGAAHPYAGMMYQEFQYRPPPPSYQASMQEYRLRLLLMDRTGGPPPPPPPVMSPPPAYRSGRSGLAISQESRPPSYRSRASDRLAVPIHARHPSQLSYLSLAGTRDVALTEEEPKDSVQHASVVPVIPCPGNKASIRISADMDQYMTNIQDQFDKISKKTEKKAGREEGGGVTIVTSPSVAQYPVVVTVSGQLDSQEESSQSQGKVDITAHL